MSFHDFSSAVYPFVSAVPFLGFISGAFGTFIHTVLKANGLDTSPRAAFWTNVLLSSTPFLVLVLAISANGFPDPVTFWSGVGIAVASSQAIYHGVYPAGSSAAPVMPTPDVPPAPVSVLLEAPAPTPDQQV